MQLVNSTKILVAIANYGTNNDAYLERVLEEYRSMPFRIDIVVQSDRPKTFPGDVEVQVGLPTKDPWSLPFAHKKLFAERAGNYDLFIYSEDDILISERNIRAFAEACAVLSPDEIAGFIRVEKDALGKCHYCDFHGHYHWDSRSLTRKGGSTFGFFTNEHSASYVLTREQLRKAINSGGFLVEPYRAKYPLPETAATDAYTRCGFKKLICISRLADFTVQHLSNKYIGNLSLDDEAFREQLNAFAAVENTTQSPVPLLEAETKLHGARHSKSYYEPVDEELLSLIPGHVRSVLSVGCGWGAMEERLVKKGFRVVAIPLDPVIGACAEARGVRVVYGDLKSAVAKLGNEQFDCLLMSNVLHLVPDPVNALRALAAQLSDKSITLSVVPNHSLPRILWRSAVRHRDLQDIRGFQSTGVNLTSKGIIKKWFGAAGLRIDRFVGVVSSRTQKANRRTLGLAGPWLASQFVILAAKH